MITASKSRHMSIIVDMGSFSDTDEHRTFIESWNWAASQAARASCHRMKLPIPWSWSGLGPLGAWAPHVESAPLKDPGL
jgi:hypothetical protein